jgi:multidrug efflux pump subunit AcrA (membrane-fusion protein)
MSNKQHTWRFLSQGVVLASLFGLFVLVRWAGEAFQKPGHMGVIESQSMEMTVRPPEGAMPVETAEARLEPFAPTVSYTGSAVAFNDIALYPRVEGVLTSIPVYPGDRVRRGQVLAQVDARELNARVREAQFARQSATQGYHAAIQGQGQAQAQVEKARQAIHSAQANLQYWQNEIQRAEVLAKEEVITPEEAQKEQSQFAAAQSEYRQALAELRAAQRGAAAARFQAGAQAAQSAQATASVQAQQIVRGYATMTAPQDGVIIERLLSPGSLAGPTMQVLRMAQIQPIRLQANVAEQDLGAIRPGNRVLVRNTKHPEQAPIQARITAVFPNINPQTRTGTVEAVFPNTDERFFPGDYLAVDIQTAAPTPRVTVPTSALVARGEQQAVWVVQDGKAQLRFVTTGGMNGQRTVIANGLQAGERVVVQGNQHLSEGVLVSEAKYGPTGLQSLPKAANANRLTAENGYQVRHPASHYLATVRLKQPPRIGQNLFEITVASGPGMTMPLGGLSVEMASAMPSMASMRTPKPTVRKMGDGRFEADAMLGMGGLWQMTVTVSENGRPVATFPVEVEVPQ